MKPDAEWLLVEIRKLRASIGALASTGGLRTPAHHTTHESGGSDAIKLDDLAATDDNTDLDASATKHGLMPKWTSALISALLDLISSTRGVVLYRGASAWAALSPNTDGKVLTTHSTGADPTWESATGGITQLTGDVTAGPGSGSVAATIAADAVTNAKLADMAQSTFKGRAAAAGTGNPVDLTANEASTILDGATDPFVRTSGVAAAITRYKTITFVIGDGVNVISAGEKGVASVDEAGTIVSVTLLASDPSNTAGAIVIDLWKDVYANFPPTVTDTITASAKPTITATNTKSVDSTLTGWGAGKTLSVGDVIKAKVDSVTSIKQVTMFIRYLVS